VTNGSCTARQSVFFGRGFAYIYSRLPPFVTPVLNISRFMGLSVFKIGKLREQKQREKKSKLSLKLLRH